LKSRLHSECDGQNNCCILQGKTPLTPFSAPSLAGEVNPPPLVLPGPPCSAMMPKPHMEVSSMMPMTSPSPPRMMPVGICSWNEAAHGVQASKDATDCLLIPPWCPLSQPDDRGKAL
uniref:Uncharacterized protein n=1 Tax=Marmota marmota marmota TaxID=9994 RepID=A0A8C5YYZ2_MARMA